MVTLNIVRIEISQAPTKCGGILVYISDRWSANNKVIHHKSTPHLEIMTIKSRPFWLPREIQNIITVACYCPQTEQSKTAANTKSTKNYITQHIQELEVKYPNAANLVMGDFNTLPLKLSKYQQVVTKTTRAGKTLDKCFVNVKNAYKHCQKLSTLGKSDHNIIHLILSYNPKSLCKPKMMEKLVFLEGNSEILQGCFDCTDWDVLIDANDNINQQVEVLTGYNNFCTDLCIPSVQKKLYQNSKPWVNEHVSKLLHDKLAATRNGDTKTARYLQRSISKELIKAKKQYIQNIEKQLSKNPAKAWRDVKKMGGLTTDPPTTTPIPLFSADQLNTFFSRFEKDSNEPHKLASNNKADENQIKPLIADFQVPTVQKLLKNINGRKGAGPDKIIPRVIKICSSQLAPIITRVLHTSIEQTTTPNLWKSAIIKPLPKVQSPSQPKDYRPIAITSVLGKILEKLIKWYVCQHTELDPLQFAYRSGRSTQDAVLQLITTVTTCIDAKASNLSRCLFLDFSSAFNTINVSLLIDKLQHLDSRVTKWVSSFLSNRIQYTQVDGKLSEKLVTNTGTPQGTVLSPLLFSIYTDSIRSEKQNVTILKYADDTVIIGNIAADADFVNYLDEISRISLLCKSSDLLLNPTKTNEMLFTTQRNPPDFEQLSLDGTVITPSTSVKYLGVTMDNKLRFETHIADKISSAKQRLYLVKQFKFLGASNQFLNQIFSSFVESCFFNCLLVIFTNLYDRDIKSICNIHKTASSYGLENCGFDCIATYTRRDLILSTHS